MAKGYRKYTLNEDYFEVIDAEDKAYFLGLLYADGYNQEMGSKFVMVQLQEQDKHILEEFQQRIGSNGVLHFNDRSTRPNHSDTWRLQLNSKKLSEDLKKQGCPQAKSKILLFPTTTQVPEHLQRHFIRGYFDGDGCVWDGKRRVVMCKDSKHKDGQRERVVHNVKFNITGTEHMMSGIQEVLVRELGFKCNKINTSKNIGNCVQLEYSGRRQMKAFYEYLYQDATVYFHRKKRKFEATICAPTQ